MFLARLAKSFASVGAEERRERWRQRKLERGQVEREMAAIRERQTVKPNPLIIALHKRVEALGIASSLMEQFRALPENEQRRYEIAAGASFAECLPVYLSLEPGERGSALVAAGKSLLPFSVALDAYRAELRRTVADDDLSLL